MTLWLGWFSVVGIWMASDLSLRVSLREQAKPPQYMHVHVQVGNVYIPKAVMLTGPS